MPPDLYPEVLRRGTRILRRRTAARRLLWITLLAAALAFAIWASLTRPWAEPPSTTTPPSAAGEKGRRLAESLLQVLQEVVDVLDAHRETNQVGGDLQGRAGRGRVRHAPRVLDERLHTAQGLAEREHLGAVADLDRRLLAPSTWKETMPPNAFICFAAIS